MKNIICILAISLFLGHAEARDQNTQFSRSIDFMMMNMIRTDIAPGAIIAAPSKQRPDYFYHWTRDAALVLEAALDLYQSGQLNLRQRQMLQKFFLDHVQFSQLTQQHALKAVGLGEPKFFVDGRVYTGSWGRPQNDGPALRSSSLIRLLSIAMRENWPQVPELKRMLYQAQLPANSILKLDLEFTAKNWRAMNIDLWEEVYGLHFYTLMTQRKSLALGSQVAQAFSDPNAANYYKQEYARLNQELNRFWDEKRGYIHATINTAHKLKKTLNKSQLDSAVILAVLHTDIGDSNFTFTDDRVLSTFQRMVDSFSEIYAINKMTNLGPAIGRYPEDTYDGYNTNSLGNPWVLSTAGSAEFLYRLTLQLTKVSSIKINQYNQAFYIKTGGLPDLALGKVILKGSPEYQSLLKNLVTAGDNYLSRVMYHANSDGSLSEQMNRGSGFMQGAPNLTWSHASFITAKLSRDKVYSHVSRFRK